MTTKGNPVRDKSFALAPRIVKLAQYLQGEKREYVLSKQVVRSGTAVGPRKTRKDTEGDEFFSEFRAFRGHRRNESTNHTKGTKLKSIFSDFRVFRGQKHSS